VHPFQRARILHVAGDERRGRRQAAIKKFDGVREGEIGMLERSAASGEGRGAFMRIPPRKMAAARWYEQKENSGDWREMIWPVAWSIPESR